MPHIIGRKEEQAILESAVSSGRPEFIALYGRRRVGKTYLVRTTFEKRKNLIFFKITGIKDGTLKEQLTHFTDTLSNVFQAPGLSVPDNWYEAFKLLTHYMSTSTKKTTVLFFDEFPWMATRNSRLLKMLEHYWNNYWSGTPKIKLIICGSSSSWILTHIIHNTGGLYNRVTETIHLKPFTLHQAKLFLHQEKITLNNHQILQLYMILGGIPYYLSKVKPGLSAAQAVESLAFSKDSFLMSEFRNLYATLFDSADGHTELARIIALHRYGIEQEELAYKAKHISSGGGLTKKLEELEQAGFIQRFKPYLAKKKGIFYKMVDEYSLFYFNWIEPIHDSLEHMAIEKGYWEDLQKSSAWHSWQGYAFEAICYKHLREIRKSLHLNPFSSTPATWRYIPKQGSLDDGAQIDLLFDRKDGTITMCEIKYSEKPFVIDKQYAAKLHKKIEVFVTQTKTTKQIFLALIAAGGLKKNLYSDVIAGVVTLTDLFE